MAQSTTHSTTNSARQRAWQRIILLSILGLEAVCCLFGGSLLVVAPDGRNLGMPVSLMNGAFEDFLIPGLVLFAMGIINATAFIAVLQRTQLDWLLSLTAMAGMFIWFVVEIAILGELLWLQAIFGIPVLIGWILVIPLMLRGGTD